VDNLLRYFASFKFHSVTQIPIIERKPGVYLYSRVEWLKLFGMLSASDSVQFKNFINYDAVPCNVFRSDISV
jgi:hypothetical protein